MTGAIGFGVSVGLSRLKSGEFARNPAAYKKCLRITIRVILDGVARQLLLEPKRAWPLATIKKKKM